LLSPRRESGERDLISAIRDIVEIVAIIAAGCWAFYVFAYENRIKPSFAEPEVNVTASMRLLSVHNGLIGIGIHTQFHNVGTVPAHFLAYAVSVYGQRVTPQVPSAHKTNPGLKIDDAMFSRIDKPTAVYTWGYITKQGNPASTQESGLDPGSSLENDQIFYVPQGRFDLLTMAIDAPYTKYDDTMPASLVYQPDGGLKVNIAISDRMDQFNIRPVTSLDIR
jgi:hypothetical protein